MKKWGLVGYACGAGASKDGCKKGSNYLKQHHIEKALLDQGYDASWLPLYESELSEPKSYDEKRIYISDYCHAVATQSAELINNQTFPLVFGGDHSMAMGTWSGVVSALNAYQNFGLMWIDAHMDAHTPSTSLTGNLHGMPLAALLGHGHASLTALCSDKTKLSANHVVMIGIRSYEKQEHDFLTSMGVKIYYMQDVKERGFKAVYEEALEIVSAAKEGFGITFDVDAFDAELVPGTGTKEIDGLRRREVFPVMSGIAAHAKIKAIEIAEFNPELDEDGRTYRLIEEMLKSFFAKKTK